MNRMKIAFRERIEPALASDGGFSAASDLVGHEAQMLALMAEQIGGSQYEYAAEELYQEYVAGLRSGARRLSEAAAQLDFNRATSAVEAIERSCTDCHADFRG